jgi:hypothetical protein
MNIKNHILMEGIFFTNKNHKQKAINILPIIKAIIFALNFKQVSKNINPQVTILHILENKYTMITP